MARAPPAFLILTVAPSAASANGPVRGRVGMGDAAADRAAVADRPIGDAGRHLAQHLAPGELFPHVLDPGVGDAAPMRQARPISSTRAGQSRRDTSTRSAGRASRRFNMGPSD